MTGQVEAPRSPARLTVAALLAAFPLPRSEALMLLGAASGLRRERLIAGSTDVPDAAVAARFQALARRRVAGEPIAYLLGTREFYGRPFGVDASVLIPRPETELLVDQALQWIDRAATAWMGALRVLDLGTGSGAVAVTIALERPGADVTATDRSDDALERARRNAGALGAVVHFAAGDWFDALSAAPGVDPRFDLIVSNPPYVAADDRHLSNGDLRFEPRAALTDFGDGLDAIRRIVAGAPDRLHAGGTLMLEHGFDQAPAVRALMAAAGFRARSCVDLAGIERVTIGDTTDAGTWAGAAPTRGAAL